VFFGGVVKNFRNLIVLLLAVCFATMMIAQAPPKEPVTLKGPSMAGVKFDHAAHMKMGKCDTCHHAAKPEKAPTSAHQKCSDCHKQPAVAPVKDAKTAFHTTCIECHKAKGGAAPVKCMECHSVK
jgi:hypothetical protein